VHKEQNDTRTVDPPRSTKDSDMGKSCEDGQTAKNHKRRNRLARLKP
jgi:hypothetical protein